MRWIARFACLLLLLNNACAIDSMRLPQSLPEPEHAKVAVTVAKPASEEYAIRHTRIETITPVAASPSHSKEAEALSLPAGKLTLNTDAMPLNRFIHLALGEVLKVSVDVDPGVAKRVDPVTLHVSRPVAAADLLAMVEDTLALFDVGLSRSAGVVRVLACSQNDDCATGSRIGTSTDACSSGAYYRVYILAICGAGRSGGFGQALPGKYYVRRCHELWAP